MERDTVGGHGSADGEAFGFLVAKLALTLDEIVGSLWWTLDGAPQQQLIINLRKAIMTLSDSPLRLVIGFNLLDIVQIPSIFSLGFFIRGLKFLVF
jgi:hypothetical protein